MVTTRGGKRRQEDLCTPAVPVMDSTCGGDLAGMIESICDEQGVPVIETTCDKTYDLSVREFHEHVCSCWRLQDSLAEGIEASLEYSKRCTEDKSFCNDSVSEKEIDWLRRIEAQLSDEAFVTILEGIGSHISQQSFPDMALARVLTLVYSILSRRSSPVIVNQVIQFLCCIMPVHHDSVIDSIKFNWSSIASDSIRTSLLLGVVESVGCREGARLVSLVFPAISIPDLSRHLLDHQLCSVGPAALVIQVVAFFASRNVVQHASIIQSILEAIKEIKNMPTHLSLLPCKLMDPQSSEHNLLHSAYRCSDSCPSSSSLVDVPDEALDRLGIFRCCMCAHLFSLECSECGSCPVKPAKVDGKACWGCGYRLIASELLSENSSDRAAVLKSTDEIQIASLLALSALGTNVKARMFVNEYLGLTKLDIASTSRTGTPPAIVSPVFGMSLLMNLGLRKKLEAISEMLIRCLFASPPSVPVLKALSSVTNDTVTEYALGALYESSSGGNSARLQSAAIQLINLSDSESVANELVNFLTIESTNLTISTKKILISKIIENHNLFSIEAIVQYLTLDERMDAGTDTLFDLVLDHLNKYWKSIPLSSTSMNHFHRIVSLFEHNHVFRLKFSEKLDPPVLEKFSLPVGTASFFLEAMRSIPVGIVPELLARQDLVGLRYLVESSPDLLSAVQIRTLVVSTLIPALVRGSSSEVRRASLLLRSMAQNRYVEQVTIDQILEKFVPSSVRGLWVMSSLLSPSSGSAIVETVLASNQFEPLVFLASNPAIGETVMARCEVLDRISNEIPGKGIDALIEIMTSASRYEVAESSSTANVQRPQGGVRCRPLGRFSTTLLSASCLFNQSNPSIALKSLQALELMDKLGIVNRRTLPGPLLARYVLSSSSTVDEVLDDTMDINSVAYRMYLSTCPDGILTPLPTVCGLLKQHLSSSIMVVNAAHRFLQVLPTTGGVRKSVTSSLLGQLRDTACEREPYTAFLVACLCCMGSMDDDLRSRISEDVNNLFSVADDLNNSFVLEFLTAELSRPGPGKRLVVDRFTLVAEILQRFAARDTTETALPPAPVSRPAKRRRSSLEAPSRKTKKARKRLPDDDEYTDGKSDNDSGNDVFHN